MNFKLTLKRLHGLFWRLERLGGGACWPLEISAVDCVIAAKVYTIVVCAVIYKVFIFRFSKISLSYFVFFNYANL